MKRLTGLLILMGLTPCAAWCFGKELEKDVPWRAQAEIARRGAMVERVEGLQDAHHPASAIAAAMQPPADDSHKWHFTLVTTRSCQWCEQLRRDFDTDPRLKAWVDTKDYAKSWAHWQIVQIEDQSQAWRWKDFRPTSFPALIVQPPVNGSWGDSHTIVFAQQGYLKPADLDAAIRKAIQAYAAKVAPKYPTAGGFQQARTGEPATSWTPPVNPPSPLPPLPSYPNYPSVPPQNPPAQPDLGSLLAQLLSGILGGAGMANFLLLAILAWQIYRGFAKREGIPLLVDDTTAAQLVQLLQSLPRPAQQPQSPRVGPR